MSSEKAIDFLRKSYNAKRSTGDLLGMVGYYANRGALAVNMKQFKQALRFYEIGIQKAEKFDLQEDLSLLLNNIGSVYRDMQNFSEALMHYQKAREVAKKLGSIHALLFALRSEITLRIEMSEYVIADKLLSEYSKLSCNSKLWQEYLFSLKLKGINAVHQNNLNIANEIICNALKEANKMRENDIQLDIILEYSQALMEKGYFKAAKDYLLSPKLSASRFRNSPLYFSILAQCCGFLNDYGSEKRWWKRTLKAPGIEKYTVLKSQAHYSLADISYKEGDFMSAAKEIAKVSMEGLDKKAQAILLIEKIRILIDSNQGNKASRLFNIAAKLTSELQLKQDYVDLFMMIGDFYWNKGKSGQLEAMKCFLAAMTNSVENMDYFVMIGIDMANLLYDLPIEYRLKRIETLEVRLSIYLKKKLRANNRQVSRILWPIELAKNLAQSFPNRKDIPVDEIGNIFAKTMAIYKEASKKANLEVRPKVHS